MKKKIVIVGPPSFGYLTKINEALTSFSGIESTIVLIDKSSFKYKNLLHRLLNSLSKIFLNKNLKKEYLNSFLIDSIKKLGHQDVIFMIRPDLLSPKTLNFLKTQTQSLTAFYYDSTRRFPKKIDIINYFDTVYSYDKLDVETYNLKFLTNYIFDERENVNFEQLFFNISTFDYRYQSMEELANYIDEKKWSKEILIYGSNGLKSDSLTLIHEQISVDVVADKINRSKIIIEIQRKEQIGLSFRVFEALGQRKKLITTNTDIVNYDFYHPQNILVIDEAAINIPEDFVNSPYIPISDKVLDKYRLRNWTKKLFDLE
ncbi:hypothetical protein N9J10_03065 [Flavobacteriaceae bacterium]|jgi:hypothetical protein|nr:hypothetical protein [Flavobacteriaceae bacterium]